MEITVMPPIKIKRGLRVELIEDHHDCFSMTSFDIRFTVPQEDKIGTEYFKVIEKIFNQGFAKSKYKDDIIHFGEIDGTGINVNIRGSISKEESLELVKQICNNFLDIKTVIVDPKAYPNPHAGIAYFNGAQSIVKEYLKDITENNQYEYIESKI